MEEQNGCRHHQTGYYKYGIQCEKITTTISAKCKSVEVEPAQTGTPGHANIFQIMAIADTKISVPTYTLLIKNMKNKKC